MPRRINEEVTGNLSDQQHNALALYGQGNEVREVAEIMGISEYTAKEHLLRARRRLGARNNAHALKIAYDLGLMTGTYAREKEAALAAQLTEQTELAEQRLRALSRLRERMPNGKAPVDAINQAVYQLNQIATTQAGVTPGELERLAHSLAAAVDFIEIGEAEKPIEAAVRVLNTEGLQVGRYYAQLVLDANPDIIEAAAKHTWEDSQIREILFRDAVLGLTAMSHFRYSTMREKDGGKAKLALLANTAYRTQAEYAHYRPKVIGSAA